MLSFSRAFLSGSFIFISLASQAFEVLPFEEQNDLQKKQNHYLRVLQLPDLRSKKVKYAFLNCTQSDSDSNESQCGFLGKLEGYSLEELKIKLSASGFSSQKKIPMRRTKQELEGMNSVAAAQAILDMMTHGPQLGLISSSNPHQSFEYNNGLYPLGMTSDFAFLFLQYRSQSQFSDDKRTVDLLGEDILVKTIYPLPKILGGINYLLKRY